jgi:histone deacetylase complex regulatory component SIN3
MAHIHHPDPNVTAVHQDVSIPMSTTGSYNVMASAPSGAGTSTGIYSPPYNGSYSVEDILRNAKPYLYQKSEIVDKVAFEDAIDEATLKDNIRAKLSHQMIKHITENINFTRINDVANDTMTIYARCYVFTKEQLYDLIVKAKGL